MPYIKRRFRDNIDIIIDDLCREIQLLSMSNHEDVDGMINYAITKFIQKTITREEYKEYAKAIGILETVKLEFYRKQIAKYEDIKCCENGEVYE